MSNVSKGQIQLPDEFRPGEPIRAGEMDKLRQAIAFALKDMIGGGRGITVTQSAGKYLISARKQRGGVKKKLPLQIIRGSGADKFRITPGVVNSVTPTLGGTAIDDEEPPEFTVTEDTWVWLKCVGTFGSPDTYVVTVETSSSAAVPAGTDISATGFVSFYSIGNVDFTSGDPDTYEITNRHSGGNLGVDSWGLYNLWWRA